MTLASRWRIRAACLLLGVTPLGCGKDSPESSSHRAHASATAETNVVEVTAEGSRFDPPVPKARIPDGAWMCDMGKVHYAASEKGDGKCPVCGMELVKSSKPSPQ